MAQKQRKKNEHGQYFTPANVVDLMVSLLQVPINAEILEPSSGEGVFLRGLAAKGFSNLQGVEIDPTLQMPVRFHVDYESFVSWDPARKFDAVVGNPPYIRWRDLGSVQKTELQASPYWGSLLNPLSDYLTVFIAKAIDHLRPGGELVYVTPDFWMRTQHSSLLRDYVLSKGAITDVVHFGESSVFKGVSSSIVIFRFVKEQEQGSVDVHTYTGPRNVQQNPLNLSDKQQFKKTRAPKFKSGIPWSTATSKQQQVVASFERWATHPTDKGLSRVGDGYDIANGMVSGLDSAFRISDDMYENLSVKEQTATIRVTKASQLRSFVATTTTRYVYLPDGMSESKARREYPALIKHLKHYRDDLDKRYGMGRTPAFWEWSFPRSAVSHFDKRRKVFVPCKERMTCRERPRFAVVPAGAVATQDVTALAAKAGTKESVYYAAAFLSLDEIARHVRTAGLMKGGVAEFSERPLASLPFRYIDWDNPAEVRIHDAITKVARAASSKKSTDTDVLASVRVLFTKLGLP